MRFIALFLVLALSVSMAVAEWYQGLPHAHSTFSDGQRTPEVLMGDAIAKGSQFLIPTDHYEYIPEQQKIGALIADDFGFEAYQQRFCDNPEILGKSYNLIVLPCTEMMFAPSHLLVLGDLGNFFGTKKVDSLQAQIEINQADGLLSVAAHPSKNNYWFDRALGSTISGIEFFNEGSAEYQKTRSWYMELIRQGRNVWVIGGWDTHNPATDPYDGQRRTWVYAEGPLTRASLIEALRNGQTYAANWGASISALNYIPNGTDYKISEKGKTLQLKVSFPGPIVTAKKCYLYDNGQRLGQVMAMKTGAKEFALNYPLNTPGKHALIFEVEGCLITSPIKFEIGENAAEIVTRFTGNTPILLGKTKNEIRKLWGQVPEWTDAWLYPGKPLKDFYTDVIFYEFNNSKGNFTPQKTDRAQIVYMRKGLTPVPMRVNHFAPAELVPPEILRLTPTEICRSPSLHPDCIIVIWRYGGNTYALVTKDTRRKLFDELITKTDEMTVTKYQLNQFGRAFRATDSACAFIQILGQPELFGQKFWFESGDFSNRGSIAFTSVGFYRFDE